MSLWIGGMELLAEQPVIFTESDDEGECRFPGVGYERQSSMDKSEKEKTKKKELRRDSAEMSIIDRTRYMVYSKENQEPYDHMKDAQDFYRVTEEFKSAMKKDPVVKGNHEVKLVVKATLTSSVKERYASRCARLHDEKTKVRAYFCGGLDDPARLTVITKQGFSEKDFINGEYGRGLYFSLHPSRAAHFSATNKLLIVEVAVGRSLMVEKKDHTRASAPQGYDSVTIPGRLASSSTFSVKSNSDPSLKNINHEFIIFDVSQVLPLHVVEYSSTHTKPST